MNTFLLLFLAFLIAVVVPTVLVFALKSHQKALKITTIVFACIYFVALFIGTTCKLDISADNIYISFDFTEPWFSLDFLFLDFSLKNVFVNISMMFPLGFIVYIFTNNRPFRKTILIALIVSICIEFYQFVLPIYRNTEITDIIFNIISGLISATYCEILKMFGAFEKDISNRDFSTPFVENHSLRSK